MQIDNKIQLSFVPTSLPIPDEEVKRLKYFQSLKKRETRLNKHWKEGGRRYVILNFKVSILFENCDKEKEEFSDITYTQNKKINDAITRALLENFVLTSKDQLEYSWFTEGKYVKILSDLKFDTAIIYSNIIIDAEYEFDFWISCIEILLRNKKSNT